MSKTTLAAAILMLSTSAFAGTGYYVQSPAQTLVSGGPTSSFGQSVAVLTTVVQPGSYLITARIDGQSYAPNSGAACYFTYNNHQAGTQYYVVNTSTPDWSHQSNVSVVALNRFTTDVAAQVNLMCAHGYSFANPSMFGGEMTLTPVDNLGQ